VNINTLWVEKYRPKTLEELILPGNYKKEFEENIKRKDIGNLLLYGPPGSGKSSIALILASPNGILNFPESNLLMINGSARESRGIGCVDTVIEPFCKFPPSGDDKLKIVFIDESDYFTDQAIHSLRYIIEKFSKYVRFIFTCNYVSKIPEAIYSRTQAYEFKQMPKEYVNKYCLDILEKENIENKKEDIEFVVNSLYPDIRRIVNCLQKNSLTGKLTVSKESVFTNETVIMGLIIEIINFVNENKQDKVNICLSNIVKVLNNYDMDFRGIYSNLFFNKDIPANCKIIINRYSNGHGDCLIPQMHFMAMIFEIIKTLIDYKKCLKN